LSGNNFYDQEMVDTIKSQQGSGKLSAFILMERLVPPAHPTAISRFNLLFEKASIFYLFILMLMGFFGGQK
jgi:hypothetical protein